MAVTLVIPVPDVGAYDAKLFAVADFDTLIESVALTRGSTNLGMASGTIATATGDQLIRLVNGSNVTAGLFFVKVPASGNCFAVELQSVDWSQVYLPTSTIGLTGTTIATSQVVASVSGAVGSVAGLTASNLDTTISSRSSQTSVDDLPTAAELATDHGAGSWATATGFATVNPDNTGIANAAASAATAATQATTAATNTGTLLTRIPAALFAGMTSLAQWLGLIAAKHVGNTTARTELNATGAGSGTFDETTDSEQAIRDRGDAAWITGSGTGTGARLVTITVDDGTDPLENATVRMSQGAESYSTTTNASGIAVFALDDATWTVTVTKALYSFTPTTLVVNGTETATYSMTATVITPSSTPETTGYGRIRYAGAAVVGAVVEVEITRWANGTTGSGITPRLFSAITDSSGDYEIEGLPRLATYRVRVDNGEWTQSAVLLDATTTPLIAPIGPLE